MNNPNRLTLLAFCGASLLVVHSPAIAQGEDATALEEVVVTAQKREQNIQDVPIAIDALSRDSILAQRIAGLCYRDGISPGGDRCSMIRSRQRRAD